MSTVATPSYQSITTIAEIVDMLWGHNSVYTIFEFGSRYGEDSIEFARRYPGGTIYSFECNPNTVESCKLNISPYKNIILTEKAVSNINGQVSFFKIDKEKTQTTWEDGNQGASSLLLASGKYPVENYVQEEVIVESTTLSTFMFENNVPMIDILWMDIQGAELLALQGLGNDITKVKLIHLEVEFFEIYKNQPLFDDISGLLTGHNFAFVGYSSRGDYSGDAIFINKNHASEKQLLRCREKLEPTNNGVFAGIKARLKSMF